MDNLPEDPIKEEKSDENLRLLSETSEKVYERIPYINHTFSKTKYNAKSLKCSSLSQTIYHMSTILQ